jgi:hypothetical protein
VHYYKAVDSYPAPVEGVMWGSGQMIWGIQVEYSADICATQPATPQPPGCTLNDYQNRTPVVMQDNYWHCIESHIIVGNATTLGVAEMFVNGTQTASYPHQFIQAGVNDGAAIKYVLFYRQSGGYQWRFETSYVLSTTRVGCGGGSGGDTTPPAMPTNFGVS